MLANKPTVSHTNHWDDVNFYFMIYAWLQDDVGLKNASHTVNNHSTSKMNHNKWKDFNAMDVSKSACVCKHESSLNR